MRILTFQHYVRCPVLCCVYIDCWLTSTVHILAIKQWHTLVTSHCSAYVTVVTQATQRSNKYYFFRLRSFLRYINCYRHAILTVTPESHGTVFPVHLPGLPINLINLCHCQASFSSTAPGYNCPSSEFPVTHFPLCTSGHPYQLLISVIPQVTTAYQVHITTHYCRVPQVYINTFVKPLWHS